MIAFSFFFWQFLAAELARKMSTQIPHQLSFFFSPPPPPFFHTFFPFTSFLQTQTWDIVFYPLCSRPEVFAVYLLLMGVLVWVPPGVPPQARSDCGVMQGSLRRLFRSQAAVTHSRSSSAEWADAPSNAALADHSAANGTGSLGPTVPVTATHKGAQEDANQDECRFFFFSPLILH